MRRSSKVWKTSSEFMEYPCSFQGIMGSNLARICFSNWYFKDYGMEHQVDLDMSHVELYKSNHNLCASVRLPLWMCMISLQQKAFLGWMFLHIRMKGLSYCAWKVSLRWVTSKNFSRVPLMQYSKENQANLTKPFQILDSRQNCDNERIDSTNHLERHVRHQWKCIAFTLFLLMLDTCSFFKGIKGKSTSSI